MPHRPFVRSSLDESSLRVGDSEADDATTSQASTRKSRPRPSAINDGSRALSKSLNGAETHRPPDFAEDDANDHFNASSSGSANGLLLRNQTISDTGATNSTERTSDFADVGRRPSSRGAVDDDPDDPLADPLATTKPLLASPPPALRHHLLFPPLGDDVVEETDPDVGRLRASFTCQLDGVYRHRTFQETPDVNTNYGSKDAESTDATRQQSRITSRRTVVMPDRDAGAVNISDAPIAQTGSPTVDESHLDVGWEEETVKRLHRPDGNNRRLVKSTSPESSCSYGSDDDDDARLPVNGEAVSSRFSIDGDGTLATSVGRISNDEDVDASFGSTSAIASGSSRLWPTTTRSCDDAETPIVVRPQWPRGRQAISPSGSFVDAGRRNESARRLFHDADSVSAACSLGDGGSNASHRPPRYVRASTCHHSRRVERVDAASSVPSSSSYLSDGASSTSSRTSSVTSSISSSLDHDVRKRWDNSASSTEMHPRASSGTRRRRGRRLISSATTMQAIDGDGLRRLPRVAHRNTSTNCQIWDEYQVN